MAYTQLNPNSCNPVTAPNVYYQVYNNGGGYTAPALAKGVLTLVDDTTNPLNINYAAILYGGAGYTVTNTTTGTAKIATVTVGATAIPTVTGATILNGITVGYKASCNNGQVSSPAYQYVTNTTDTTTTVATALAAAINADGNASVTATSSTAVVTITAKAAGNDFILGVTTAALAVAYTGGGTALNVNPSGNPADLIAQGVPSGLVDGAGTYTTVVISWNNFQADNTSQPDVVGKTMAGNILYLFAEVGAAATAVVTGTNGLNNIMLVDIAGAFTLPNYIGH